MQSIQPEFFLTTDHNSIQYAKKRSIQMIAISTVRLGTRLYVKKAHEHSSLAPAVAHTNFLTQILRHHSRHLQDIAAGQPFLDCPLSYHTVSSVQIPRNYILQSIGPVYIVDGLRGGWSEAKTAGRPTGLS